MRSAARAALVALVVTATSGCATYADRVAQATRAASVGDYAAAVADMNGELGVSTGEELPSRWTGDVPLAVLERGSLQQALGQYAPSARNLSAAEQELELLDLQSDPIGELGSYLYSDSAKTYRTPPTERLSVNAINLLNYLARGDLDGAAVEARRFQVMRDYLATLDVEPGAPDALGAYLAGVVFEHLGEGDRALRYYEEALAAGRLASLDAPIARLARLQPYRGPRLNEVLAHARSAPAEPARGELLVVLSVGRVPHKEARRIPIGAAVGIAGTYASGNVDWLKYGAAKVVVYPELVASPSSLGAATVHVDGAPIAVEPLADLAGAIRSEYEEAKPRIVAAALSRMAARAAMAEGVRAGGRQQSDALGDVLSILFESTLVALDRPDTRSWTMLPARVLVARAPLAPGAHTVDVTFGGGVHRSFDVDAAGTGLVAVVVTEPR